jgi:soluble lytic murein transglycosylase-like protein
MRATQPQFSSSGFVRGRAENYLKNLNAEVGTWTLAVARYNADPDKPAAKRTYVCAVIRNMVASGFGQWTANVRALCQ